MNQGLTNKIYEDLCYLRRYSVYFMTSKAVLLCHPVIVGLTTKMQDLMNDSSWVRSRLQAFGPLNEDRGSHSTIIFLDLEAVMI